MMSSLLDVAVRRAGEGGFDKPVAILAGVAAGAMLFLMPVDVLQNLVIDSGLPAVFPPAEPPLGFKARALIAVAAAVIAFAATYGLMRLLGRKPAARPRPAVEEEFIPDPAFFEEPAPRMRRRDLHPDAPVRAPLFASRHLGDPAAAKAEPPLLLSDPEPEPMPVSAPEPMIEPVAEEEEELILDEPEVFEEFVPTPSPVEAVITPAPAPEPRPQGDATIGELLARLERALEKKPLPQWLDHGHPQPLPSSISPPEPAPLPAPADEPMDARLRSALESLKRFAPSHG